MRVSVNNFSFLFLCFFGVVLRVGLASLISSAGLLGALFCVGDNLIVVLRFKASIGVSHGFEWEFVCNWRRVLSYPGCFKSLPAAFCA